MRPEKNDRDRGPDAGRCANFRVRETTAAMARGDPVAAGAFYEAWFDRAYAMVRFLTKRDEAFCLDVVQDAMLKIVRSIRPFDDANDLRRWVARVLHTTAMDSLRREARREHHERRAAERRQGKTAGAHARDRLEIEERIQWLEARLRELPAEDRQLLLYRFGLGRTLRGVGTALGMTAHAAHGRIRRLLARLRASAGNTM